MWREVWIMFGACLALGFAALAVIYMMARQVNEDRKRGGM